MKHTTKEPQDLMILRDAAKVIKRRPVTIRAAIHRGRLKGYRRGRDWWVSKSDLQDYVESVANRNGT